MANNRRNKKQAGAIFGAMVGTGYLERLKRRRVVKQPVVEDFNGSSKGKKSKKQRGFFSRWFRRLIWLCVLVALLPFVLIGIYALDFVHPVSSLMMSQRISGQKVVRDWVPIEQISPNLIQSVMMSEDGRFCSHNGVDWQALGDVIDDAMEGEKPRGASTIPMQTVKNLFLWNGRSYVRKVIELPLALAADAVWSKRRMMEIYLNITEWGPGVFGAQTAAKHHFKRSAKNLNRRQSALLAVSLPNPLERRPSKPTKSLRRLAKAIEGRARKSGAYVKCIGG